MPTVDQMSPDYVGEDRITLSLDTSTSPARALSPVQINVDYALAEPQGASLPLELIVNGPTYLRKLFRTVRPPFFVFIPELPGEHLVLLRETGHNRWVGRLLVEVVGDRFQTTNPI